MRIMLPHCILYFVFSFSLYGCSTMAAVGDVTGKIVVGTAEAVVSGLLFWGEADRRVRDSGYYERQERWQRQQDALAATRRQERENAAARYEAARQENLRKQAEQQRISRENYERQRAEYQAAAQRRAEQQRRAQQQARERAKYMESIIRKPPLQSCNCNRCSNGQMNCGTRSSSGSCIKETTCS